MFEIGDYMFLCARRAKTTLTLSPKDGLGTVLSRNPGDWLYVWWSLLLVVVGSTSKGRLQSQQSEGVGVWGWLSLRKNNSMTLSALSPTTQSSLFEEQSRYFQAVL